MRQCDPTHCRHTSVPIHTRTGMLPKYPPRAPIESRTSHDLAAEPRRRRAQEPRCVLLSIAAPVICGRRGFDPPPGATVPYRREGVPKIVQRAWAAAMCQVRLVAAAASVRRDGDLL